MQKSYLIMQAYKTVLEIEQGKATINDLLTKFDAPLMESLKARSEAAGLDFHKVATGLVWVEAAPYLLADRSWLMQQELKKEIREDASEFMKLLLIERRQPAVLSYIID